MTTSIDNSQRLSCSSNEASDGVSGARRYMAIVAISLGTALTIVDGNVANVALPTIAKSLNVSNSASVQVVTVYNLVLVMTLLPFSAVGDRVGLKRMYQTGQLVFTIATAACFFVNSFPLLLLIRALQALGGSAALSVMSALIRHVYPQRQLGRAFGINTLVASISTALAPSIGGLIVANAQWQWIFLLGVPFAVLSLVFGRVALPVIATQNTEHSFDRIGALCYALTVGLLFIGVESYVEAGALRTGLIFCTFGVLMGIALLRMEIRHAHPILPIYLLRLRPISSGVFGLFACFVAMTTLFLSLPFRLEDRFGLAPGQIGLVLAAWPVTSMISAPFIGSVVDRYSITAVSAIGVALAAVALATVAAIPSHPSLVDLCWRMSLGGLGMTMFLVPNIKQIVSAASLRQASAAGGLISTTRLVAQTAAACLVSILLTAHLGDSATPSVIAAILVLVVLVFDFILQKRSGKKEIL